MKRNKFILTLSSSLPLSLFAQNSKFVSQAKGFVVNANEGRKHGHIKLKGVNSNILDVKVSGEDTEGQLAIFEQTGLSPGRGTPLHVHHFQDEIFKVIEGEYHFQVGLEKHQLKAGDTIFLPKKVPHAWTQVSDRAKMNVIVQPAGKLEAFFLTMAAFETEPNKEQIARVFSDNGMEVVGPPMKID